VRELEQTLEQRERALAEREAELTLRLEKIAELERQIAELDQKLRGAARDKQKLEARLKELLAKRRALADEVAPGQLALAFGEAPLPTPPCAKEAPDGETKEDKIRPRHVRRNAPREISYAALPREHVQHELPETACICPLTGKTLVVVGEKTTEELEYRPGKLVVLVHHRALYGLCEADRAERTTEPLIAPAPLRPIENALAGAALLAWILVQKYCHHLPLYRQQAIFQRDGLELPRQTLCDWVLTSAYILGPIQRALQRQIVASGLVQLDDTPVQCQGGKGAANFQAYLWTYASPLVDGVVFDFAPDRGHEHVERFMGKNIEGYLVGDGYAGYGALAKKHPGLIEVGCWAHAIRKCRDALEESPAEASWMMTLIGKLFDVESAAIERKLEPDAVHAVRAERSRPVLDRIREKLEELRGQTSDQGSLAKALTYLANQWPTLVRFLEDGRVPIHNNACEVAIRPIGVGRKNWLFAGSERGGHAAATIYTLVESCRRAGVDPFLYLRDVLVRVATHPAARVHELIPASWKELFGSPAVRSA
jgi:transposase